MNRRAIALGLCLLAGCGSTPGAAPLTSTTTTSTTTTTTTQPPAPTTTVNWLDVTQVAVIEEMFPADRRVEICLMQLRLRNGGLPEHMIIDLGVESFSEGLGQTLEPEADRLLRSILGGCFR